MIVGDVRSKRAAAFFDVDGTLVDTTIVHYYRYFMSRRLSALGLIAWYPRFCVRCLYYLILDRVDRERFNIVFYRSYRGLATEQLKAAARDCYRDVIVPRQFDQAAGCLAEHRAAGRVIVLITGSIDFIIQPFAEQVAADHVLAASLVEADGVFTGALTAAPVGGEEKARRMRQLATREGIDLTQSHAYGDSVADLAMLEAVGFAHAVNPDRQLASVAADRGWSTHHWTRSSNGR